MTRLLPKANGTDGRGLHVPIETLKWDNVRLHKEVLQLQNTVSYEHKQV